MKPFKYLALPCLAQVQNTVIVNELEHPWWWTSAWRTVHSTPIYKPNTHLYGRYRSVIWSCYYIAQHIKNYFTPHLKNKQNNIIDSIGA